MHLFIKRVQLLFVFTIFMCSEANAQQYQTAFGVKGDWSTLNVDLAQLSLKHFFSRHNALEANLGAGRRYIWLEGVYHHNRTLKGDVDWYSGTGADFGYWNTNYDQRYESSTHSGFWLGANGVLGIEYTTGFIPINLSLDAGPTVRLVPDFEVGLKIGFACRFAFR